MWHEARRREKATQKLLSEHKKRAEKRREENRVDPNSLLQIHGLKAELCLDPSVYKQAVRSLVAWQGDESITIDRFDVRATLSSIPNKTTPSSSRVFTDSKQAHKGRNLTVLDADESEPVKKLLNYERYRLLIQNDLNKVPEELRLKWVAQSDVSADAKMRKLRYNKFGTSGDASIAGSGQISSSLGRMGGQFREPTRRPGAAIGFNYNSVPPPDSLNPPESGLDNFPGYSDNDASMKKALGIIDSDEFDNFELDGISDLSHIDSKRILEIVRKYGLSHEEFLIMAKRDNQDNGVSDVLKELKKMSKRSSNEGDSTDQSLLANKVYGPDLPPELAAQNHPSPSTGSSSNCSPVGQRSPSGARIPLRNGHKESDDDSIDHKSSSRSNGNLTNTKVSISEADANAQELSSISAQSSQNLHRSSESLLADRMFGTPPIDCPPNLDNNPCHFKDACIESQETTRIERNRERRASTPLAYKRNRRSSRSLSREKRSSHNHRHRHSSTSRSSRRPRRSRSKSNSSESTVSSHSSSAPSKYARRKHRSRQRMATRR